MKKCSGQNEQPVQRPWGSVIWNNKEANVAIPKSKNVAVDETTEGIGAPWYSPCRNWILARVWSALLKIRNHGLHPRLTG